jgi:hypothetical protein
LACGSAALRLATISLLLSVMLDRFYDRAAGSRLMSIFRTGAHCVAWADLRQAFSVLLADNFVARGPQAVSTTQAAPL